MVPSNVRRHALAQRLAASSAISNGRYIWMIHAIHIRYLFFDSFQLPASARCFLPSAYCLSAFCLLLPPSAYWLPQLRLILIGPFFQSRLDLDHQPQIVVILHRPIPHPMRAIVDRRPRSSPDPDPAGATAAARCARTSRSSRTTAPSSPCPSRSAAAIPLCTQPPNQLPPPRRLLDRRTARCGSSCRIRVSNSAGGSAGATRSDERRHARNIFGQLGARAASGQMTLEGSPLLSAERSVHVVAQQDFQLSARHIRTLCRRRTRANSARPRFSRDFTVPSGTFSTCAISRYSNSSRSRRITVSRNSGDKFLQGRLQHFAGLASGQHSIRSGQHRGGLFEHLRLIFDRFGGALHARPAVMIDQQVPASAWSTIPRTILRRTGSSSGS